MGTVHELYERYARDVYRFAVYLSGNPTDAEDILSETFVRLWTAPGEIRNATVKAYLLTIARNVYRSRRAAASRFRELDASMPDERVDVEARAAARSELARVFRALKALPEVDRSALLMRMHDVPYDEISPALGLSVTAAKVKVHRARMRLLAGRTQEEVRA